MKKFNTKVNSSTGSRLSSTLSDSTEQFGLFEPERPQSRRSEHFSIEGLTAERLAEVSDRRDAELAKASTLQLDLEK